MSSISLNVTDINGVRYTLLRQIGRGGQGAVYEVAGGRLAAKIIFDASPVRRERLRNQLTHVKRLALQDLEIARPIEMLREPSLGYVMELLTGMMPLKALSVVPKRAPSPVAWYFAGGGLRRRLQLLGRTADILAALHGKGLVYSDPSPDNIFISESVDANEVRLIDADNLHYTSTPGVRPVFTPGYGAPELVRGKNGVSTLTDAHAFAVLAFQTLCLVHPLMGDEVVNGEPEREERALAGELPWIDDPTEARNRSTRGIGREVVLSPRLREIAEKTFGAGVRDHLERPGTADWAERLHTAANATLTCPSCRGTYYFSAKACPWCEAPRPAFALATFHLWDPSHGTAGAILQKPHGNERRPVVVSVVSLGEDDPYIVTRRLAELRDGSSGVAPVVELQLSGARLDVRSLDGQAHRLVSPTGGTTKIIAERPTHVTLTPGQASWRLHLGAQDKLHRVVSFELRSKDPR